MLREKNQMLTKVYNRRAIERPGIADEYIGYGERLRPYVADTSLVLGQALDEGRVVLLEGAQATMLDVDHGTYPFVLRLVADGGRRGRRIGHRPDPDHQGHRDRQGVHDQGRTGRSRPS